MEPNLRQYAAQELRPDQQCARAASQLGAACEVLHRRRERLRRQLDGLRVPAQVGRAALHPVGDRIVRRRRHEQLRPGTGSGRSGAPRGPDRLPGPALPGGLPRRRSERTSSCWRCSSRPPTGRSSPRPLAIVLVTPLNFVGNKLWSFGRAEQAAPPSHWQRSRWRRGRTRCHRSNRAALQRGAAAHREPFAPSPAKLRSSRSSRRSARAYSQSARLPRWLDRYPSHPQTDATFDERHGWAVQCGRALRAK